MFDFWKFSPLAAKCISISLVKGLFLKKFASGQPHSSAIPKVNACRNGPENDFRSNRNALCFRILAPKYSPANPKANAVGLGQKTFRPHLDAIYL